MRHAPFTAFAALLAFAAPAAAADLRICVEGAYPPFSEISPSGELIGFDIDVAKALCADMGKSCDLVATDWDGIIESLNTKKCDAIIASMSITPDRMQVVDFTNKYYHTPGAFVAEKGAGLEGTPDGLAGKRVGVQRGTIHDDYMVGEFPKANLVRYGTQEEATADLSVGRLDAVAADKATLDLGFLRKPDGEGFEFFGGDQAVPKYHGPGAGVAIRKGEEDLKAAFNTAIDDIRASGVYAEINAKYFPYDIFGAEEGESVAAPAEEAPAAAPTEAPAEEVKEPAPAE